MNRRRAAEAALVWNTVVWGATFVMVKAALHDVSPLLFLALRFSVALAALLAIFRRAIFRAYSWRALAAGALAGTFLFSGYLLQTLGLRLTTAPRSAFLTGLTSVAVPLLAALVYRSRPQLQEVVGVVVATAGLVLMTLPGVMGTVGLGDLLTIGCALAFAAHIVTVGHYAEQLSFELLSVTQIGSSAIWGWVLCAGLERAHVVWRPAVLWAILITGLLATALAFSIQAWAQRYTSSTRTALIFMLEPVVAWITSYWWEGEGLSGRAAAGAVLILSGVLLVEFKPGELKPPHPRTHQNQ